MECRLVGPLLMGFTSSVVGPDPRWTDPGPSPAGRRLPLSPVGCLRRPVDDRRSDRLQIGRRFSPLETQRHVSSKAAQSRLLEKAHSQYRPDNDRPRQSADSDLAANGYSAWQGTFCRLAHSPTHTVTPLSRPTRSNSLSTSAALP